MSENLGCTEVAGWLYVLEFAFRTQFLQVVVQVVLCMFYVGACLLLACKINHTKPSDAVGTCTQHQSSPYVLILRATFCVKALQTSTNGANVNKQALSHLPFHTLNFRKGIPCLPNKP